MKKMREKWAADQQKAKKSNTKEQQR
jgi:hypothetical protein